LAAAVVPNLPVPVSRVLALLVAVMAVTLP